MRFILMAVSREYSGTSATLVPSDSCSSSMDSVHSTSFRKRGLSYAAAEIVGTERASTWVRFARVIPVAARTTRLTREKFILGRLG